MQIRVLGVPQTGAKSRVETQIKLCIQLVTDDGDKAQRWSHLKLPEHMVVKEKLKRQALMTTFNGSKMSNAETTVLPQNILYLSSRVICASDPNRKVATCSGCIQREVIQLILLHKKLILFSVNDHKEEKKIRKNRQK